MADTWIVLGSVAGGALINEMMRQLGGIIDRRSSRDLRLREKRADVYQRFLEHVLHGGWETRAIATATDPIARVNEDARVTTSIRAELTFCASRDVLETASSIQAAHAKVMSQLGTLASYDELRAAGDPGQHVQQDG